MWLWQASECWRVAVIPGAALSPASCLTSYGLKDTAALGHGVGSRLPHFCLSESGQGPLSSASGGLPGPLAFLPVSLVLFFPVSDFISTFLLSSLRCVQGLSLSNLLVN